MQETSFHLRLITQDRVLLDGEYGFAVVPAGGGPLGVLPGHAPLLGTMQAGVLKLRDPQKNETCAFVDRGFFMIARDGITITARVAEAQEKIDVERATAARERARQNLSANEAALDIARARAALGRAEARLKAAQGKQ